MQYAVADIQGSQIINPMTQNSKFCSDSDIDYSMTITSIPTTLDPSFITFNALGLQVLWTTSDKLSAGVYTITVTGSLRNISKSVSFTLTVTAPSTNHAPTLDAFNGEFIVNF
jgi:hypothetical protein